jgi:hypothetical protein
MRGADEVIVGVQRGANTQDDENMNDELASEGEETRIIS